MAPELFQKRQYDEKVDVFAFGALLWELVSREVPYDGLDPADIRVKVEKGEVLKLRSNTDPQVQQLINSCREVDYTKRCTFDRIVQVLSSLR